MCDHLINVYIPLQSVSSRKFGALSHNRHSKKKKKNSLNGFLKRESRKSEEEFISEKVNYF